jgi:hypothetical protein
VSLDIEFTGDVYLKWPLLMATTRVDPSALQGLVDGIEGRKDYSTTIRDMISKRREKN